MTKEQVQRINAQSEEHAAKLVIINLASMWVSMCGLSLASGNAWLIAFSVCAVPVLTAAVFMAARRVRALIAGAQRVQRG